MYAKDDKIRNDHKNFNKINRCQLLIIDEISTMNLKDFGRLNKRCQLFKNCFTKLFGGLNMLIVGDFGQLKPVLGKFESITHVAFYNFFEKTKLYIYR